MFYSARLKLTFWYLTILMCISVGFSMVIFRYLSQELERFEKAQRFRFQRQMMERGVFGGQFSIEIPLPNPELIDETRHRIFLTLLFINLGILVFAGAFGFILAGKTLTPIQESMEREKQFFSDASHELKTPLTAIKSSLEVHLRDEDLTLPQARSLLNENLNDINRLSTLTQNILTLSKEISDSSTQPFTFSSLSTILSQAEKNIAALAREKQIKIHKKDQNLKLMGNPEELVELFTILLDNAIKYSPPHSTVHVSSKQVHRYIHILVKDEGIGIEKKDIPHIFERFYRSDSARAKRGSGGFGLGLAIAKNITTNHHGTISVESSRNGSTFIVQLPLPHKKPKTSAYFQ